MADISSITLPGGGTYDLKDKNAVPKYGMGKNLLDNAYFVGGGSQLGDGVFPVNQRGQTVYPSTASGLYFIDRWDYQCRYGTVTLNSNGINMAVSTASGANWIRQKILGDTLLNKQLTVSILDSQGNLRTFPVKVTAKNVNVDNIVTLDGVSVIVRINISTNFNFIIRKDSSIFDITIQVVKLELGTEQTLAHQENGVWVLNEIPDYEEELIKCQTSTADTSDTYANKSLATEQQIAYVETGTTASRSYAVGEYFCWNGLLNRAKTAISRGESFTVGTNCEQATVGEAISKNNIGTFVNVSGYTASSKYTIPTDGYLMVEARNNGYVQGKLGGPTSTESVDVYATGTGQTRWTGNTVNVRAGMMAWQTAMSSSDSIFRFYPLV